MSDDVIRKRPMFTENDSNIKLRINLSALSKTNYMSYAETHNVTDLDFSQLKRKEITIKGQTG